ncbi:MAG TPA: MerR family transcriptional regulator [Polyangiaceae bacterium]
MKADPNGMTIDELARRTRTTTRTLRLYQTRALLPPPRIVGRVGYYTEMHVNRLLLIERLQTRGFSLAGIGELLKMWEEGKGLDELFGFEAKLVQPWNEESPEDFTPDAFAARYPDLFHDASLFERVREFGVVEKLEDGTFRVLSPLLMSFGQELVSKGVPFNVMLGELAALRADSRRMAKRFITVFRTHMLPGMVQGGPMEWLPRLANYVTQMRPAVRNMLVSVFAHAMDEEIQGMAAATQAALEEEQAPESDTTGTASSEDPPVTATAGSRR